MPLFLTSEHYIKLPLEPSFMEAWPRGPAPRKKMIEATGTQNGMPASLVPQQEKK